ncbi:MAG TPA: copper resistance protein B [Sphingomonas sp.]
MRRILAAAIVALIAGPAAAQSMAGMAMPGMVMPKPLPARKPAAVKHPSPVKPRAAKPAPARPAASRPTAPTAPMAGMDMSAPPSAPQPAMPGMAMNRPAAGTDLPPGNAPAPPPPADHYADRTFSAAVLERVRTREMREDGALHRILFNLAEIQIRDGHDGYRWDGEGWFGGDLDRLVVKSEGGGTLRRGVASAEAQALYSHAISPYFDLQAGVRQDIRPSPARTYATIGIEGLAPYMFETEAALFLSTRGDLLARVEGWHDARLTQRLILQPRVELNFAAQEVRADRIGAGLTDAELGLRLRYEISRQFAPYAGVSYDGKVGRTASLARADGEGVRSTSLVLGIRGWF